MTSIPTFLAGEQPSASKLQQLGFQDSYTPILTASSVNPTLGTGAQQVGLMWISGQRVDLWSFIRFGTSGAAAGTGTYRYSIPPNYPLDASFNNFPLGGARLLDDSGSNPEVGQVIADIGDGVFLIEHVADGDLVAATNPWTWDNLDTILIHATWLTDFGA